MPLLSSGAGLHSVENIFMSLLPSVTNKTVAPMFHSRRLKSSTSFGGIPLESLTQTVGRPSTQSTASICRSVKRRRRVWPWLLNSGASCQSCARSSRESMQSPQPALERRGDSIITFPLFTIVTSPSVAINIPVKLPDFRRCRKLMMERWLPYKPGMFLVHCHHHPYIPHCHLAPCVYLYTVVPTKIKVFLTDVDSTPLLGSCKSAQNSS